MSILGSVSSGASTAGQRIVISAVEKVGKTTLACDAPRSLLVPMEMGYAAIRTPKTRVIETYQDVCLLCEELIAQSQRGQIARGSTIVWDSATALERLIHDAVLRSDPQYTGKNAKAVTMESALGGYGKAYGYANELFERWTRYCDALAIHGGINIVVTCHVFAAKVVDPAHGEYDTWDLQLHSPKNQKTYGKRELITQWADMVGFLHEPMFIMKAADGETMNRGIAANQGRMLAVERTPGWVAGNRYGLTGLIPIPGPPPVGPGGGWNALAHAIYANTGIDLFNRG